MTNYIIIDNFTNSVIAEFENYDLIDVICPTDFCADDEIEGEWFSVYEVGETMTEKVAVFDSGNWYESDGYTVLNY